MKIVLTVIKNIFLLFLLIGCNVPNIPFIVSGTSLSELNIPLADNGYSNLSTQVIETDKEYKELLQSIEQQNGWEHKVDFGIKIGKIHLDFKKDNLLIYRHNVKNSKQKIKSSIIHKDQNLSLIKIVVKDTKSTASPTQAIFYRISKQIQKVRFLYEKSDQIILNKSRGVLVRSVKLKLKTIKSIVPQSCIAWFDGCNHCIRSANGKPLCTKRYCKKKGQFRCMKWK